MQNTIEYYNDLHGQEISFYIPDNVNKICINVSGGADSAIISYMTIKYCQEYIPDAQLHIITCANQPKGWYNAKWSSTVIDRLLEITGTNMIKSHYTYFDDDQRRQDLNAVEFNMTLDGKADFFIHGTTQNPPLDIEHLLTGRHTPRDVGHNRKILKQRAGHLRYMPLMGVDKRMVAHLYEELDMMELLFPYTRSCEQESQYNKDTPSWMTSHCGECWWCKERKWAFGRY